MGANTTYIFYDTATKLILIEFTFMFGDPEPNIGKIVHIKDGWYEVLNVTKEYEKDMEGMIDESSDCIVHIELKWYCENPFKDEKVDDSVYGRGLQG